MGPCLCPHHGLRKNQHGQGLIIVLVLLGVAVAAVVYNFVTPAQRTLESDRKTAVALAQARDALIGYAAAQKTGGSYRPGVLPCPDTIDNGNEGNTCDTPGVRIGRLPWKTLRLPDPRDGSGERLWYAVSDTFKNATQTGILNSDTPGDFTISGATPASNVIAVVFAPGAPLGSQDRNPAVTTLCPTTGTTLTKNLCAVNYLEGGNEDGDTAFTSGLPTDIFNDKLLLITSDNFFPAVVMRVASEMRTVLTSYYRSRGYFPNASPYSDPTYACNPATFQGRVPDNIVTSCSPQGDWVGAIAPWFGANNWRQLVFYAVSSTCTNPATPFSCTGELNVVGVSPNALALVIATGRAYAGQNPFSLTATASDSLDDAENTNGDTVFVKPTRSSTNNDGLFVVAP